MSHSVIVPGGVSGHGTGPKPRSSSCRYVPEVVDHERRLVGLAQIEARLLTTHLEPEAHPLALRDLGRRRQALAVVELPPGDPVHDGRVLDRIGIEGSPVRPEVHPLVVALGLNAEDDAGVRPRVDVGHRHVDLDDAVRELDAIQVGEPREALPPLMLDDARVALHPEVRIEPDDALLRSRRRQRRARDRGERPGRCPEAPPVHARLLPIPPGS
jgi:hypothetical protein